MTGMAWRLRADCVERRLDGRARTAVRASVAGFRSFLGHSLGKAQGESRRDESHPYGGAREWVGLAQQSPFQLKTGSAND